MSAGIFIIICLAGYAIFLAILISVPWIIKALFFHSHMGDISKTATDTYKEVKRINRRYQISDTEKKRKTRKSDYNDPDIVKDILSVNGMAEKDINQILIKLFMK